MTSTSTSTSTSYPTLELVKARSGYLLYRSGVGSGYVVEGYPDSRRIYSIPADSPPEGGAWCSPHTDEGIRYAARMRLWPAARRLFARLAAESAE